MSSISSVLFALALSALTNGQCFDSTHSLPFQNSLSNDIATACCPNPLSSTAPNAKCSAYPDSSMNKGVKINCVYGGTADELPYSFIVPTGVTAIDLQIAGAAGDPYSVATATNYKKGGTGAVLTGTAPFSARQVLFLGVNTHGGNGVGVSIGGGGQSSIGLCPSFDAGSNDCRVYVAGGGGQGVADGEGGDAGFGAPSYQFQGGAYVQVATQQLLYALHGTPGASSRGLDANSIEYGAGGGGDAGGWNGSEYNYLLGGHRYQFGGAGGSSYANGLAVSLTNFNNIGYISLNFTSTECICAKGYVRDVNGECVLPPVPVPTPSPSPTPTPTDPPTPTPSNPPTPGPTPAPSPPCDCDDDDKSNPDDKPCDKKKDDKDDCDDCSGTGSTTVAPIKSIVMKDVSKVPSTSTFATTWTSGLIPTTKPVPPVASAHHITTGSAAIFVCVATVLLML